MTPGLHPQIERFAQYAQAEMSSEQAAEILGVSKRTILNLLTSSQIEASLMHARDAVGTRRIRGRRVRWTITDSALLAYLIQSCNKRTLMLASIHERLPQWHAFAERIASGATVIEARVQARRKSAATHASNVLPFDPGNDLFPDLTPAKAG